MRNIENTMSEDKSKSRWLPKLLIPYVTRDNLNFIIDFPLDDEKNEEEWQVKVLLLVESFKKDVHFEIDYKNRVFKIVSLPPDSRYKRI